MKFLVAAVFALAFSACAAVRPPEARRRFVMGGTFMKEAKSPADFERAADAFREAVRISPDWLDARYNLAVALESLHRYDEARKAYEAYIAGKPSRRESDEARDRIYALEAKAEMAAAEEAGRKEYKQALDDAAARAKTGGR